MKPSEAQRRASQKWNKEKVDPMTIRVPKGTREVIQKHADEQEESVNAFVNRAIQETMIRDKQRRANHA